VKIDKAGHDIKHKLIYVSDSFALTDKGCHRLVCSFNRKKEKT